MHQASPLLTEDRAQECIDPRLGDQYPPTGALKVSSPSKHNSYLLQAEPPSPCSLISLTLQVLVLQLGRIAVQCLQYDPTFRPSMGTIARVINYAVVRDQQGVV